MKTINRLIYICIALALTSCAGMKKKKAYRYFNENNKELAELCLERFPIKEKTVKGDTVTIIDTLKIIDKVPVFVDCPDGTKKECPPKETKYIERIRTVTDTIIKIDTREKYLLELEIQEKNDKINSLQKQRKALIYTSVSLLLLLVVSRILK